MQYDVSSPEAYLKALDEDWRKEKLLAIRELILKLEPSLDESIRYKMLCFSGEQGVFCQLNAQQNYVSVYFGNLTKIDPDGTILKRVNMGKGCIRFSKTIGLEESGIESFLLLALKKWKSGEDIDC